MYCTHAVFVTVSVASKSSRFKRARNARKLTRCVTCAVDLPLYHWVKILKWYFGTLHVVRKGSHQTIEAAHRRLRTLKTTFSKVYIVSVFSDLMTLQRLKTCRPEILKVDDFLSAQRSLPAPISLGGARDMRSEMLRPVRDITVKFSKKTVEAYQGSCLLPPRIPMTSSVHPIRQQYRGQGQRSDQ